jgi:hypothetical protein
MIICGPRRARTVDPRIKSPLLYRLSYRPHCALTCQYFKSRTNRTEVLGPTLRVIHLIPIRIISA